jgi:hypothetical protein
MSKLGKFLIQKRKEMGFTTRGVLERVNTSKDRLLGLMYHNYKITFEEACDLAKILEVDFIELLALGRCMPLEMEKWIYDNPKNYKKIYNEAIKEKRTND